MSQVPSTVGPIDAAIRGQRDLPTPPPPSRTQPLVDREPPAPRPQGRGFVGSFKDAWDANAIQPAINRLAERVGVFQKTDPGFKMTPEIMRELSVGIPDDQLGQFGWAVNRDHATVIRGQILDRMARQERLANDGWSGVTASLVASLVDYNALMIDGLATVATLPLGGAGGYLSSANRVRKAIGLGEDATRMAARSRLALGGQAGAQGALANGAVEGILAADGESDLRNVALAGAIGFGVAGSLSMLGTRQLSRDARAAAELMRAVDESEIAAIGAASQTGMWYDMARAWQDRMTDPVERQALGLEPLAEGVTPNLADDMAKLQRDVKVQQARRLRDHVVEVADNADDAKRFSAATDDELLEIVEAETKAMEQLNALAVPQSTMRITANVSGSNAKWAKVRVGGAATLSRMTSRTPTGRVFAEAVLGDTLPRVNGKIIGLGAKDQADALTRGAHYRLLNAQKQLVSSLRKEGGGFVTGAEVQQAGVMATRWLQSGRPDSAPRHVKEYGESLSTIFRDYVELAKDARVTGSERFELDPNYVPQRPSAEQFHNFMQVGKENRTALHEAISLAWERANTELIDEWKKAGRLNEKQIRRIIDSIGVKYTRRLMDSRLDTTPYSEFDFDRMADIIRSTLEGEIGADRVTDLLRSIRPTGDQGTVPAAFRSRTALDLDVTVGDTGVPLRDFYEQDLGILAPAYARDMARASARQATLDSINAHFGLEGDKAITRVDSLVSRIEGELANSDVGEKKMRAAMREIRQVADALEGRPLMNQTRTTQALRIGKGFATGTFGASFGLAQIVESGTSAATVGVQRYFNAAPAAAKAMADAMRGVPVDNDVMKLMDYMGHGVGDHVMLGDFFRSRARSVDDYAADAAQGGRSIGDKLDLASQKMARAAIIAGGMEHMEAFQRRVVSLAGYDWVMDTAMNGIKRGDAIRMGLDDVRARRLEKAVAKWQKAGYIKRDGNVLDLDVQRAFADDADAFYDLRDAIGFIQSNVVQRQRLASVPPVIARNQLLNVLAQFRGFAIGAYEQQLLLNVAAKDATSFATAGYTMSLAALVVVIQENIRLTSQGATQEEREEALSWDRIGRIAFRRAGWASMFPDLADSAVQVAGFNPIFSEQARVSGLSNNVFDPGNYAVAGMMDSWAKASQAAFRMALNGEVAEQDVRAVQRAMPLQNQILIRSLGDRFANQFPEREELRERDNARP